MNNNLVQVKLAGSVLILSLYRPEALNALNRLMLEQIRSELLKAGENETVKVIVITGEGEKSFAAGADISEFAHITVLDEGISYSEYGQSTFTLIEGLSKPVIAAVNGYALGGGLELALACDIRIASEKASFGFPEVNLGILPGFGGTQRAANLIGRSASLNLMYLGEPIKAEEAKRLGLVDLVYGHGDFMNEVMAYADKISRQSSEALSAIKQSVTGGGGKESLLFGERIISPEAKQRIHAFLEKRKPK